MLRALGEFEIEGIHTTIPAHELVLDHPDFAAGEHSTRWLEESVAVAGQRPPIPGGRQHEPFTQHPRRPAGTGPGRAGDSARLSGIVGSCSFWS